MTDTCNYYYTVMPFGLKNAEATYQRLMDKVFHGQIGKNLEMYIDDIVVRTEEVKDHSEDLGDFLSSIRKHNALEPYKVYTWGASRKIYWSQAGEQGH